MHRTYTLVLALAVLLSAGATAADYPAAKSPAVADGTGYVEVPGAAVPIEPSRQYKVIVDGLKAAAKPTDVLPALGRASLIVNALAVGKVPQGNRHVVVVFHGPAVDGLLLDAQYQAKFGAANPNLKVIDQLAAAGVELFVCAQHMANHKLGMEMLSPRIKLATAASLVLITYQNQGYAVLADQ
jgi:intracellular sulfur oxidation DsrE/DsrF family protein